MRLYDYTAYPKDHAQHAVYGEVMADTDSAAKAKIKALCPHCGRIELSILSASEPFSRHNVHPPPGPRSVHKCNGD